MALINSFTTARLVAERVLPEHFDAIREMDSDPAYMALLGGVRDAAGTAAYLEKNLEHWDRYGHGLYMLRDAHDHQMTGRCVLRHLDVEGTDEVELGYGFYPRYWGKGLATEVARELLRLGREALGLPTLIAVTTRANVGSQRVLVKTGLVYERDFMHADIPHMLFRSTARAQQHN
ncbi:MAG: GNAT family N-acetyltransferase [Gemmatimonadales bacterium]